MGCEVCYCIAHANTLRFVNPRSEMEHYEGRRKYPLGCWWITTVQTTDFREKWATGDALETAGDLWLIRDGNIEVATKSVK